MPPKKQQLTTEQLKRLKRLAIALDEKNPVVTKHIFEVEDALEAKIADIQDSLETVKQGRGETGPQGIRGEKGEKGDKGDAGKDGRDGAKGRDGKDGKDGADGKDGFVDVATVAYLEDEIKQVKSLAKNNMRDGLGLVVRQLQAGTGVTIDNSNQEYPIINATATGGGHTIEEEGTPLTQRTKLNFVGTAVTVTDDAGDDATVVTITGGGGGIASIVAGDNVVVDATDPTNPIVSAYGANVEGGVASSIYLATQVLNGGGA